MNYGVTLFVSRFGFAIGIFLMIIVTIVGFATSDYLVGLLAFASSLVFIVPFLMFCEGMHALVTIANNTKKPSDHN